MSSNIIASTQLAKERLINLLTEINLIEFKSSEPSMILEQKENFYIRGNDYSRTNFKEFNYASLCLNLPMIIMVKIHSTNRQRMEEEEKYELIIKGDQGLFQILHEGKEAIITLTNHKDETDQNYEVIVANFNIAKPQINVNSVVIHLTKFTLLRFISHALMLLFNKIHILISHFDFITIPIL
uniref:Uncharacterized protein n=1 Tax=Wuchereria bancrofti TaxID=6293 RepID=A0AAF5PZA1_WUCBA